MFPAKFIDFFIDSSKKVSIQFDADYYDKPFLNSINYHFFFFSLMITKMKFFLKMIYHLTKI